MKIESEQIIPAPATGADQSPCCRTFRYRTRDMDAWLAMAASMCQWDYHCIAKRDFSFEIKTLQSTHVRYVYKDIEHKFATRYVGGTSDILLSYVRGNILYKTADNSYVTIDEQCLLYDLKHSEVELCVDSIRVYSVEVSRQKILEYINLLFFRDFSDICFLEAIVSGKTEQRMLRDMLLFVHSYSIRNPEIISMPLICSQLDQLVLSTLLQCTRHTCKELFAAEAQADAPGLVTVVEDYLSANAHTSVTIADLARFTGRSGRTIQATFKKCRGYSPSDFLKECRLQNARRMLLSTELSVTSIAFQCGFPSVSHFARYYRQRFGTNPSASRKIPSGETLVLLQ